MSQNYHRGVNNKFQNKNTNYIKNINTMMSRMQSNVTSFEGNSDKILLISQPSNYPVYPNGMQSLLGSSVIPVIAATEKQMTFTEKNLQIIEEVRREKEKTEFTDKSVNEIYLSSKSIQKCDLHPKQLSDKCRKCKEIKIKIEKIKEERKVVNTYKEQLEVNSDNLNTLDRRNNLDQNMNMMKIENNNEDINQNSDSNENPELEENLFKSCGDPITCNLNPLILNNILSCQYFKEDCALKGFNEILEEIIQNVEYAEPWAVGISGVPSTLFCCLYKLMLLKLTENQVKYLVENNDSAYIKCVGFLYIRYLTDPKDLWDKLSPYLAVEQVFHPKVDRKFEIKMGKYVENLLTDYDYYGTRLPRIPMPIEREIKAKLIQMEEERKRICKQRVVKDESRSRSKDRKNRRKHKRRKSYSRSSSSCSHHRKRKDRRSRSRSRSSSKTKHEKKTLIEQIKEQERESALAKGKDYAAKPSSYKSSLSQKLPGPGHKKRRSRSPSPQYEIIERKSENIEKEDKKPKKTEYSKEFIERQEILKKQYGAESTSNKDPHLLKAKIKPGDETGPEIMRLG